MKSGYRANKRLISIITTIVLVLGLSTPAIAQGSNEVELQYRYPSESGDIGTFATKTSLRLRFKLDGRIKKGYRIRAVVLDEELTRAYAIENVQYTSGNMKCDVHTNVLSDYSSFIFGCDETQFVDGHILATFDIEYLVKDIFFSDKVSIAAMVIDEQFFPVSEFVVSRPIRFGETIGNLKSVEEEPELEPVEVIEEEEGLHEAAPEEGPEVKEEPEVVEPTVEEPQEEVVEEPVEEVPAEEPVEEVVPDIDLSEERTPRKLPPLEELNLDIAPFLDIRSHSNGLYIYALAQVGVVQGVDEKSFEPDRGITRAELIKVALEANGIAPMYGNFDSGFSDVSMDSWYGPYVLKAFRLGIVNGFEDGTFRAGDVVSRAEVLKVFLLASGEKIDESTRSSFKDVSADDWYARYVNTALNLGLIEVYDDFKFAPYMSVTRGDAMKLIVNILGTQVAAEETYNDTVEEFEFEEEGQVDDVDTVERDLDDLFTVS